MRIHKITYPDLNNGIGCRVTLWISGCSHHCKGCHNKETWSFLSGKVFNNIYLTQLLQILALPYIKGLTLSGGDPLDSAEDVLKLIQEVRKEFGNTKDIWLYTGYKLEELNPLQKEVVKLCDTLVDGPYIEKLRDVSLPFVGSSNQRIINNEEICKS